MDVVRILAGLAVAAMAACASAPAPVQPPPPVVAGDWLITVDTPMGNLKYNLSLVQEGSLLSGTLIDARYTSEKAKTPFTGTVDGNAIEFDITVPMKDGGRMKIDYSATVNDDAMNGVARYDGGGLTGELAFIGARK